MKRTNKVIATVVAVMMVMLMAVGCGNKAGGNNEAVGTWKITSAEAPGMTMTGEMLSLAGMDNITFTLSEDGTAAVSAMDESVEGTWSSNGNAVDITIEGETASAQLEDGKLTMESDGVKLILEKE